MRFVLKLIAAPFALVFTVLAFICTFMLQASSFIFSIVSGLVLIGSVILFITGEVTGWIAFLSVSLLVSPMGLPALAGKLSEALANAGGALRGFIAR